VEFVSIDIHVKLTGSIASMRTLVDHTLFLGLNYGNYMWNGNVNKETNNL
jgi:hypothetical protein